MKKIISRSILFVIGFSFAMVCQCQDDIKSGVKIGEKVPAIMLTSFYGQPGKQERLFDQNKDLVILDFWNVWCSACISAFPKLDSLQSKFSNKIQIILVTSNHETEVKKVFTRPFLKGMSLPVLIEDSILSSLFPHETVPHQVWVNRQGIVEYITYGYNATERHISNYLEGRKPVLSYKNEQYDLDFSRPLWAKENEPFASHINYFSYFTGWLPDCGAGGKSRFLDSATGRIGLRFINMPVLSLYKVAYGGFNEGDFRYDNRLVLNASTPNLFDNPATTENLDDWNASNLVCYEISLPLSKKEDLYKIMQGDLWKYLNYSAHIEKRKSPCLILIRTSDLDKIKSKGQPRKIVQTDSSLLLRNGDIIKGLVERLRLANPSIKTPILDETGYTGKIDLKLNCILTDITALKKELSRYDLDLILEDREVEMLVIDEKNACCENHGRH